MDWCIEVFYENDKKVPGDEFTKIVRNCSYSGKRHLNAEKEIISKVNDAIANGNEKLVGFYVETRKLKS